MTQYPEFYLAAIRAALFLLDRNVSTKKACQLIEQIVFLDGEVVI